MARDCPNLSSCLIAQLKQWIKYLTYSLPLVAWLFWFAAVNQAVQAAPSIIIQEETGRTTIDTSESAVQFDVWLDTDGQTIDTFALGLSVDLTYFATPATTDIFVEISQSNVCTFLAPADSTFVPPGQDTTTNTPYFANSNAVIVCGHGGGISGSLVYLGNILLDPVYPGSTTLDIHANSKVYSLGTSTSLTSSGLSLTITGDPQISNTPTPTDSPTPTPTGPTPTPTNTSTPTPTPSGPTNTPTPTYTPTNTHTPTPTPSGPTNTPTPTSASSSGDYDLSADDINFVTIAPLPTPTPAPSAAIDETAIVEEDNTVPTPAEITPRPTATPFPTPAPVAEQDSGEVLAVQSIRELLIPGKSDADRKVVMFNFISIMIFLFIVALMVWRMMRINHVNKLKALHIEDVLTGELAALQTKLNAIDNKEEQQAFKDEFNQTVQNLIQEIEMTVQPQKPSKKSK